MKNASVLKSSKTDSPKTPGGISRSLLTPCRRLGLSRNFRKSGVSPFQSPLTPNTEDKQDKIEIRKRKESLEETPRTPENVDDRGGIPSEVIQTPTRNVELPRRKKSKTLLASIINKNSEEKEPEQEKNNEIVEKSLNDIIHCRDTISDTNNKSNTKDVSTPLRLKSKSRSKNKKSPSKPITKETTTSTKNSSNNLTLVNVTNKNDIVTSGEQEETKEKSPNNLTKECIVVIQKKIFKEELKNKQKTSKSKESTNKGTVKPKDPVSQGLFDSDSDDVPLICLNNKDTSTEPVVPNIVKEDDDFAISNTKISKPNTSKSGKTSLRKSSTSTENKNTPKINVEVNKPLNSQSSADDDDDDDFEEKKTILIRKSYNKVMKPEKAKSTGSITQKDIDDLKARIEMKKKLLLARTMTKDTKELKDLIKKWKKGCQDALMELMDLMKNKFPDKQNMDYSEMLQSLKIPASLVGYDSDNDCFLTPDDESILLAYV